MCFKKIIACVTAGSFLFSFIFAQPVQAVVEMHQAAGAIGNVMNEFSIPATAGKITGGKYYGSSKVVINIQDLHCHPEVQRNIGRIISALDDKFTLGNVYLEGASGNVDTSWIDAIKDKGLRKEVVEGLLDEGRLTGVEYYAMTHERPGLIKGIEDDKLHDGNIVRLGKILAKKEYFAKKVGELRADLEIMKARHLNAKNLRFNTIVEKYKAGGLDSGKYYQALQKYVREIDRHPEQYKNTFGISEENYRNLRGYVELTDDCKKLNYKRISRQLQQLVGTLKQRLPYSAYNVLLQKTDNFSKLDELNICLAKICKEYHVNLAAYPDLDRFFAYIDKGQAINPIQMLKEERKLVEEIHIGLSQDMPELEVSFLADFLGYFEEYLTNSLTAEDYGYFTAHFEQFKSTWGKYAFRNRVQDLEPDFALLDEYYRVNNERNMCFLNNLVGGFENTAAVSEKGFEKNVEKTVAELGKTEVIVVVAGGFHTEGLEKLLDARKISYLDITPNVTSDAKQSGEIYMKIAREQAKILSNALALKVLSALGLKHEMADALKLVVKKRLAKVDLNGKDAQRQLVKVFGNIDGVKDVRIEAGKVKVTFDNNDTSEFALPDGKSGSVSVEIGSEVPEALKAAIQEALDYLPNGAFKGPDEFFESIVTSEFMLAFFNKAHVSNDLIFEIYEKVKENPDILIAGKDAATLAQLPGWIQEIINTRDDKEAIVNRLGKDNEWLAVFLAIDLVRDLMIELQPTARDESNDDTTNQGPGKGFFGDTGASLNLSILLNPHEWLRKLKEEWNRWKNRDGRTHKRPLPGRTPVHMTVFGIIAMLAYVAGSSVFGGDETEKARETTVTGAEENKEGAIPIVLQIASAMDKGAEAKNAAAKAGFQRTKPGTEKQNHIVVKALPKKANGEYRKNSGIKVDIPEAISIPDDGRTALMSDTVWLGFDTKKVATLYLDLGDLKNVSPEQQDENLAAAAAQLVQGLMENPKIIEAIRAQYGELVGEEEAAKLGANVDLVVDHTGKAQGKLYDILASNTGVVQYTDIVPEKGKDISEVYAAAIVDKRARLEAKTTETVANVAGSNKKVKPAAQEPSQNNNLRVPVKPVTPAIEDSGTAEEVTGTEVPLNPESSRHQELTGQHPEWSTTVQPEPSLQKGSQGQREKLSSEGEARRKFLKLMIGVLGVLFLGLGAKIYDLMTVTPSSKEPAPTGEPTQPEATEEETATTDDSLKVIRKWMDAQKEKGTNNYILSFQAPEKEPKLPTEKYTPPDPEEPEDSDEENYLLKFASTYDQALAAIYYLQEGDSASALKLLTKFNDMSVIGKSNKESGEVRMGDIIWLGIAAAHYASVTGNSKDLSPLMTTVDGYLADEQYLVTEQESNGPRSYFIGPRGSTTEKPWVSTEYIIDAVAYLQMRYAMTGNENLRDLQIRLGRWLAEVAYDANGQRFNRGRNDTNFATDTSAWGVAALDALKGDKDLLTKTGLDRISTATGLAGLVKATDDRARKTDFTVKYNTRTFLKANGKKYRFTLPLAYTYGDQSTPVSGEWSGEMALAKLIVGAKGEADKIIAGLKEVLLQTGSIPYAFSKPLGGEPTGHGWNAFPYPSVASVTWYYFAKKGFNPFRLDNSVKETAKEKQQKEQEQAKQVDEQNEQAREAQQAHEQQIEKNDINLHINGQSAGENWESMWVDQSFNVTGKESLEITVDSIEGADKVNVYIQFMTDTAQANSKPTTMMYKTVLSKDRNVIPLSNFPGVAGSDKSFVRIAVHYGAEFFGETLNAGNSQMTVGSVVLKTAAAAGQGSFEFLVGKLSPESYSYKIAKIVIAPFVALKYLSHLSAAKALGMEIDKSATFLRPFSDQVSAEPKNKLQELVFVAVDPAINLALALLFPVVSFYLTGSGIATVFTIPLTILFLVSATIASSDDLRRVNELVLLAGEKRVFSLLDWVLGGIESVPVKDRSWLPLKRRIFMEAVGTTGLVAATGSKSALAKSEEAQYKPLITLILVEESVNADGKQKIFNYRLPNEEESKGVDLSAVLKDVNAAQVMINKVDPRTAVRVRFTYKDETTEKEIDTNALNEGPYIIDFNGIVDADQIETVSITFASDKNLEIGEIGLINKGTPIYQDNSELSELMSGVNDLLDGLAKIKNAIVDTFTNAIMALGAVSAMPVTGIEPGEKSGVTFQRQTKGEPAGMKTGTVESGADTSADNKIPVVMKNEIKGAPDSSAGVSSADFAKVAGNVAMMLVAGILMSFWIPQEYVLQGLIIVFAPRFVAISGGRDKTWAIKAHALFIVEASFLLAVSKLIILYLFPLAVPVTITVALLMELTIKYGIIALFSTGIITVAENLFPFLKVGPSEEKTAITSQPESNEEEPKNVPLAASAAGGTETSDMAEHSTVQAVEVVDFQRAQQTTGVEGQESAENKGKKGSGTTSVMQKLIILLAGMGMVMGDGTINDGKWEVVNEEGTGSAMPASPKENRVLVGNNAPGKGPRITRRGFVTWLVFFGLAALVGKDGADEVLNTVKVPVKTYNGDGQSVYSAGLKDLDISDKDEMVIVVEKASTSNLDQPELYVMVELVDVHGNSMVSKEPVQLTSNNESSIKLSEFRNLVEGKDVDRTKIAKVEVYYGEEAFDQKLNTRVGKKKLTIKEVRFKKSLIFLDDLQGTLAFFRTTLSTAIPQGKDGWNIVTMLLSGMVLGVGTNSKKEEDDTVPDESNRKVRWDGIDIEKMLAAVIGDIVGDGFGLGKLINKHFMLAAGEKEMGQMPIVLHVAGTAREAEAKKAVTVAGKEQHHMLLKALPEGVTPENTGMKLNLHGASAAVPVWLGFENNVPALYVDLDGVPQQKRDDVLAIAAVQVVRELAGNEDIINALRDKYVDKKIMNAEEAARISPRVALMVDYTELAKGGLYDILGLTTPVVTPADIPPTQGNESMGRVYGSVIADERARRQAASAESIIDLSDAGQDLDSLLKELQSYNTVKAQTEADNSSLLVSYDLFTKDGKFDTDLARDFLAVARDQHGIKTYVSYTGADENIVGEMRAAGLNVVVNIDDTVNVSEVALNDFLDDIIHNDLGGSFNYENAVIMNITNKNLKGIVGGLRKVHGSDLVFFTETLKVTPDNIADIRKRLQETSLDEKVVFVLDIDENVTLPQLAELAEARSPHAKIFKMRQLRDIITNTPGIIEKVHGLGILSLFRRVSDVFEFSVKFEEQYARELDREHLPEMADDNFDDDLVQSLRTGGIDTAQFDSVVDDMDAESATNMRIVKLLLTNNITDAQLDKLIAGVGATSAMGIHIAKLRNRANTPSENLLYHKQLMRYALSKGLWLISRRALAKTELEKVNKPYGLENADHETLLGELLLDRHLRPVSPEEKKKEKAGKFGREIQTILDSYRENEKGNFDRVFNELMNLYNARGLSKVEKAVVADALILLLLKDEPKFKANISAEDLQLIDPRDVKRIFEAA